MTHYIGILDGKGNVWGVRVPDLPGCHGGGATPEAAITDAISAAREWAEAMLSGGRAIPEARSIDEVLNDAGSDFDRATEVGVTIPLLVDRGRPVRANISLDAGLLETIDAEAKRRGLTRSAFLVSAAQSKIEEAR